MTRIFKARTLPALLLASLILSFLLFHAPLAAIALGGYTPGVPYHKFVWMESRIDESGTAFVTVTLGFPSTQYYFEGWGNMTRDCSDFYGDSSIWVGPYDGIYLTIYWEEANDFNLGQLEEGVYTFTLTSWGVPIRNITFEVGFPADINDDGKVDIKDIAVLASVYGASNSDPDYNSAADIYNDGRIDEKDLSFTIIHFGE